MSFFLTCLFISLPTYLGLCLTFIQYSYISNTVLGTCTLNNCLNMTEIVDGPHRKTLK